MSNPTAALPKPPRADGAAYMQWYRGTFRTKHQRQLAAQAARNRALRRLAALYPAQLASLYEQERRKAGLE